MPPTAEAWYPSGVGTLLAPLRPAGTLHVGALAGQETDRTYLRFDISEVTGGSEIDAIRLTVPVAADGGTEAPETAVLLACPVSGSTVDGAGGPPPEIDCDGAPAATFVDGDAPSFDVELPPAAGDVVQVALVPGGGDSWHVAFDSRDREDARPAVLVVSTSPPAPGPELEVAPPPPAPAPAPRAPGRAVDVAPPPVGGPASTPEPVRPDRLIADEEAAPPAATTVVPVGGSLPFRYPAVFALPLVMLVVVGLAGDGLTRPVPLRSEGP